jgi:hypothetical protein
VKYFIVKTVVIGECCMAGHAMGFIVKPYWRCAWLEFNEVVNYVVTVEFVIAVLAYAMMGGVLTYVIPFHQALVLEDFFLKIQYSLVEISQIDFEMSLVPAIH